MGGGGGGGGGGHVWGFAALSKCDKNVGMFLFIELLLCSPCLLHMFYFCVPGLEDEGGVHAVPVAVRLAIHA